MKKLILLIVLYIIFICTSFGQMFDPIKKSVGDTTMLYESLTPLTYDLYWKTGKITPVNIAIDIPIKVVIVDTSSCFFDHHSMKYYEIKFIQNNKEFVVWSAVGNLCESKRIVRSTTQYTNNDDARVRSTTQYTNNYDARVWYRTYYNDPDEISNYSSGEYESTTYTWFCSKGVYKSVTFIYDNSNWKVESSYTSNCIEN